MTSYEAIMRAVNPAFPPTGEQRLVIESDAPAILVVAGAGSGKTATMANRIAYHVARGAVRPDEVLGLTFTRKAAGELALRVESSLAAVRRAGLMPAAPEDGRARRSILERATVSTYNAFASDIAQAHGMLVGGDPSARLITEAERWQVMSDVVASSSVDPDVAGTASPARIVEVSLALAAGLIDNGLTVDRARDFFHREAAAFRRLAADRRRFSGMPEVSRDWSKIKDTSFSLQIACLPIVEAYFERKRSEGIVEFADQVATAAALVRAHPAIGRDIAARYRLVLLDEYQDTSVGQAEFLTSALAPEGMPGRSVCAVGDPNQAIYGWRGASSNALADFARRFGARLGGTTQLSLSTSFRSDRAILDAANAVASGLKAEGVEVKRLTARTGAGPGRVAEVRAESRDDSYRAVARRIREVTSEASAEGRQAEIAVLCRKRSYMDPMAESLRELGVPYEIVGGESLVMRPEILTVRAALGVAVNPARNDLLLRLLTLWGIGASDLRALHAWSVELARKQTERTGLDPRSEASLVEALADLPEGCRFTVPARERLAAVAAILERLRSCVHLPLDELIAHCVSILGLEVASAGSQRVKTSIDSFIALGRDYQDQHPGSGLAEFAAWLDMVDRHEHGGEGESGVDELPVDDVDVHPGVVQIMTVHAAKGLEWRDLVAVPELVEGQFAPRESGLSSWVSDAGIFPFPLRRDAAHLPAFRAADHEGKIEAGQAYHRFLREDLPEHESREARRLAYVAFTRPTEELLLAGYSRRDGRDVARSAFLEDVRRRTAAVPAAGAASGSPEESPAPGPPDPAAPGSAEGGSSPSSGPSLAPGCTPRGRDEQPGAVPDYSGRPLWPTDVLRVPSAARLAEGRDGRAGTRAESRADRAHAVRMLIAEKVEGTREHTRRRPYMTATEVVHMAEDPEGFLAQQRRPIPRRPSRAARTGTELHARIAEFYERPATLDVDAVLSAAEQPVDQDAVTREEERRMLGVFEASRWAALSPLAIEEGLAVVVGGRIVRCTVDAVFDTSAQPDLPDVTIVDWKTGRRPDAAGLASRELQLAIYRIAWAKAHGTPLQSVGACFVYLRDGGTLMAGDLDEQQIAARMDELSR